MDYSLLNREGEKELLPWCQKNQVAVIVRGPLAQGILAGKFNAQTRFDDSVRSGWNDGPEREKFLGRLATVEKLRFLEHDGQSLAQASLRYVISHPAVSTAIPGARSAAQANANAQAGRAVLAGEEILRARMVCGN
jgi:aryl-alcohol dehydrogenase-like predicted oxidoreductase